MDLDSPCMDRQVIKVCRLQDELMEWQCVQLKSFCTPSNTNPIEFYTFWDELTYKNQSCRI